MKKFLMIAAAAILALAACTKNTTDTSFPESKWKENLIGKWEQHLTGIGSENGYNYTTTTDIKLKFEESSANYYYTVVETYEDGMEKTFVGDYDCSWTYSTSGDYPATVTLTITKVHDGISNVGKELYLYINKMTKDSIESDFRSSFPSTSFTRAK